jgi:hypothetical protein
MSKGRQAMKKTPSALLFALLSGVGVPGGSPFAIAGTAEELMTKGKLAADLGDPLGAEQAFTKVVADAGTPESARAEALVRLGVVQRALGKTRASAAAFHKAMRSPGRDAQVTRLLALGLAGVAPDRTRWATQWPKVRLASVSETGGLRPVIQWPGPGPQGVREAFPWRNPVTFALEDVPLTALLHHLMVAWRPRPNERTWPGPRASVGFENWPESYQPPAAVDRVDFVIHAGVQGHAVKVDPEAGPRLTVRVSGMPWNELFENVLASNGLGFVLEKNLLFIARVEDLGAFERIRGRTYAGWPATLHFLYGNLLPDMVITGDPRDKQAWKLAPDAGLLSALGGDILPGFQLVPDANLQGTVTLRLRDRPTMQVLDLFLAANDLALTRIAPPADAKAGTTALRVSRLAAAEGGAVDLSRLTPAARPRP